MVPQQQRKSPLPQSEAITRQSEATFFGTDWKQGQWYSELREKKIEKKLKKILSFFLNDRIPYAWNSIFFLLLFLKFKFGLLLIITQALF